MNNFFDELYLDKEESIGFEEFEKDMEIIPDPHYFINNNNIIYFGFYDKTSNIFYKIEESTSKYFTMNRRSKNLEIKYNTKYHQHSRILLYNINDSAPYLFIIKKFDDNRESQDVILCFLYAPIHRKKRDNYNETSDYLLENYNLENNLLCFDCPYKNIYIPNCSKEDLNQIYNQIFNHENNEINISNSNVKVYILLMPIFQKH